MYLSVNGFLLWFLSFFKTLKGETKEVPDVVVSESVSGSISAESWTIAIQEENRNETSDLSGSSANESALNSNSLKEDAGETTALLGM